jgi:RluA family pseudouridine synthase/pseudouridine synthase
MIKIRLSTTDILFENENFIAINKKSGWVVHQTLDKSRPNLFSALQSFIKQRDRLVETPYLTLHHRLDLETSGIILFGKTKESNKVLADVFENKKATKIYHAICTTSEYLPAEPGVMEDFLKKQKIGKIEMMTAVKAGGQKTITKFKVLKTLKSLSLIEFTLVTGRMHQIRVQSSNRNFPILGDSLYGNHEINKKYHCDNQGQLLHATSFEFFDTLSNENILIKSKPPFSLDDLQTKDSPKNKTYILFNKPYNVLCQFTKENDSEQALCDFSLPKDIYPAGRLDKDSEGLLLLTNDGDYIHKISSPKFYKIKTYWAQVEHIPTVDSLEILRKGVTIKGGYLTRSCQVKVIEPNIPERIPPIRKRKTVPTCWIEIKISEGKNRQVRSMTAAIGHPTLRLIRVGIGAIELPTKLIPGDFLEIKRFD